MRTTPFVASLLACLCLLVADADAFHDGGVGACQGCHTMHVSQDGRPDAGQNPQGTRYLLRAGNATDTCLRCHDSRGQMSSGAGYGPGGDFYWLTRTFTWTTPQGATQSSTGNSHGHNVTSGTYNIVPDPVLAQAPGGVFLGSRLGCTSCHDPHGNANFRMLYGSDLGPIYEDGSRFPFAADAPLARGATGPTQIGPDDGGTTRFPMVAEDPSKRRATRLSLPGGGNETNQQHTVYKSGMSEWCANCHPGLHGGTDEQFRHPAGAMLAAEVAARYNAYLSTDDPDGGNVATSYMGLVPFEAVTVDLVTVDPSNATFGPSAADQVMCLSCHRAHASPFADAGRWDFSALFLTSGSHPQAGDGGASDQDVANRYYGYSFTANQRSLCNKCHAKDYGDAPYAP